MSTLHLVRHGQASFLDDNYDRLSSLGMDQARLLGQSWARLGLRFDQVFCGPRQRQQKTAELVGEVISQAGLAWPELQSLDELDEYDADGLIERCLPQLMSDSTIRGLLERFQSASEKTERARSFEHLFQAVMRLWERGQLQVEMGQRWQDFQNGVEAGLRVLTEPLASKKSGLRVAAFTSAGTIGAAVGSVLQSPGSVALELGWAVHNSSVTEFKFTKGRVSLSQFNVIAHLPDPASWTFR